MNDKVSEVINTSSPSIEDVINNPTKSNRKEVNKPLKLDGLKDSGSKWQCVDGCYALTDSVYRMTDTCFIFPITPASLMSEYADQWSADDRKNIFGQTVQVTQMNSEAGAAGALHGALVVGGLGTTFTASQGLLLMIPNMYKIAGEMLPCVIHVGARAIAGQALSIYGDHTDVMAARSTGFSLLSSWSVQQAHDFAIISHAATLESLIPILHFSDGFRTTHEIKKCNLVSDEVLRKMMPQDKLQEHRRRGLNPLHPDQRGTAQGPDIYMQMLELANQHYDRVPSAIQEAMDRFFELTGRKYEIFDYHGAPDATSVIVVMGSGFFVVRDYIDAVSGAMGESDDECTKVGVLGVHLFNPWSAEAFMAKLPLTCKRIAVLDRTKEGGSQGEPLFCQVATSVMTGSAKRPIPMPMMCGGRYGLGSKDFTPKMVEAIFENMVSTDMKPRFTVGMTDDVTNLSLNIKPSSKFNFMPPDVVQCVFWGFGSDGTVGGNKSTIKIIGDYAPKTEVQGYFEYDAKKSGGLTISFLRFCTNRNGDGTAKETPYRIEAPYKIGEGEADFVACHNEAYAEAHRYHLTKFLKSDGQGTFLLNTTVTTIEDETKLLEALGKTVSPRILYDIAKKKANLYIMDASGLANRFGLQGKINMLCVEAFFKLSKVLPFDDSVSILKKNVRKQFGHKGETVIQQNIDIIDALANDPSIIRKVEFLDKPEIMSLWGHPTNTLEKGSKLAKLSEVNGQKRVKNTTRARGVVDIEDMAMGKFVDEVMDPVNQFEGFEIKTSTLLQNNMLGGLMPAGTAKYEKRNPNPLGRVPRWNSKACTQCNKCAMICPHGVIRPTLMDNERVDELPFPKLADTVKAKGGGPAASTNKKYSLQISVLDCTGCNACAQMCPEEGALVMESVDTLKMTDAEDKYPRGKIEIDVDDKDADAFETKTTVWDKLIDNFKAVSKLPECGDLLDDKFSIRGSQFQPTLMEFSGACSGCGETPYVKLLTQLFRDRLVIANATGCSMIWGASFPTNPYGKNQKGRGPAWANSLFEDNAEYGLGMYKARIVRREKLRDLVVGFVTLETAGLVEADDSDTFAEIKKLLNQWLECWKVKGELTMHIHDQVEPLLKRMLEKYKTSAADGADTPSAKMFEQMAAIYGQLDQLPNLSQWLVGGDGWAFDIGYGGVDHVVADSTNDVNFLILDTELYSNTGGQASKATPMSAQLKFAMAGKTQKKKDIGRILMGYEHVYVASSCMSNQTQLLQALKEADEYDGPSFVHVYSPCIEHGIRPNGLNDLVNEITLAVDTGYWPLYRYNPIVNKANEKGTGKWQSPFTLDSKKLKSELIKFLKCEARFINLQKKNPTLADSLHIAMNKQILERMEQYKLMDKQGINLCAEGGGNALDSRVIHVLYGSATGNAQRMAQGFAAKLENPSVCSDLASDGAKKLTVKCEPLEAVEVNELIEGASAQQPATVLILLATCGQGAIPDNAKPFYEDLGKLDGGAKALQNVNFAMFGLGDTSYYFYCGAAKKVDALLSEKGANRVFPMGMGNDSSEGGCEAGFEEWIDSDKLWTGLGLKYDAAAASSGSVDIMPSMCKLTFSEKVLVDDERERELVQAFYNKNYGEKVKPIRLTENRKLTTCDDYAKRCKRDFRHLSFDTEALADAEMKYEIGDSMCVYPHNPEEEVDNFLQAYKGFNNAVESRTVVALSGHSDIPDGEFTVGTIFGAFLDLFGKPSKKFFQQLLTLLDSSVSAEKPLSAEETNMRDLLEALAKNKEDAYKKYTDAFFHSYTTADALLKFQDCFGERLQLPLPIVMSLIPIIRPRAYSIASSPRYHGQNVIELMILCYEWDGKQPVSGKDYNKLHLDGKMVQEGRVRNGLCTDYLRRQVVTGESERRVFCSIKPAAMEAPKVSDNIMCVGIGSGVAPVLGYLWDRVAFAKANPSADKSAIGQLALYFGNRFEEFEYCYKAEMEQLVATYGGDNGWFHYRTAFSNLGRDEEAAYARKFPNWFTSGIHDAFPDGSKTPYVQHVVEVDEKVCNVLLSQQSPGLLFQCGNRGLPKGVQWALVENFKRFGGLSEQAAHEAMERLYLEGRAQQEVW